MVTVFPGDNLNVPRWPEESPTLLGRDDETGGRQMYLPVQPQVPLQWSTSSRLEGVGYKKAPS